MLSPRVRLALAAALFLGWIGWLGYLAATTSGDHVVLSRPQFLVSNLYVVANLDGSVDHPKDVVTVRQAGGPAAAKAGATLTVANLHDVRREQGWDGPGEYILPLTRKLDGTYRLTATPPSPGYAAEFSPEAAGRLRIYPATGGALRQLKQIEQQ